MDRARRADPRWVEIGTGAVIGAQSLVNRDVPPYAVVAGSPARVLRYRFAPELIERLLASRWWELPLDVLGELPLDDPQACVEALGVGRRRRAGGAALAHPAQAVRHRMAVLRPAAAAGVDGGQGWISFRR